MHFSSESASLVIVCRMTKRMCVFNFYVYSLSCFNYFPVFVDC